MSSLAGGTCDRPDAIAAPSRRRSVVLRALAAVAAALTMLMVTAPSASALSISGFRLAASTTAAGGHPTVVVSTSLEGGNVKDLTLQLPPGLLGNPTAAARCDQKAFASETCPETAKVGSITANVAVLGLVPLSVSGPIFNLKPEGDEPARLGLVLRALPLPLPTDVLLQSPITVRTGSDYGLDATLSKIPDTVLGIPVTITSVRLTLTAAGADGPFMSNPTGCTPATTMVVVEGYDGTTARSSSTFTPTRCEKLTFSPSATTNLAASGQTARGRSPAFDSLITLPPSQAAIQAVTVALPVSVRINVTAAARTCPTLQYVAGTCPASAQVGSATATTPLLRDPLSGPVILAVTPGSALPGLVVELHGPIPVTLAGGVKFLSGHLVTTFSNIPDVPLSRFELRINGGHDGLLTNTQDRCLTDNAIGVRIVAHNGMTVRRTVAPKVEGCPFLARATLKRAWSAHPNLSVKVSYARAMRRVMLRTPASLAIMASRAAAGIQVEVDGRAVSKRDWTVKGRELTVSDLPQRPGSVRVLVSGGALNASRYSRHALRKGRLAVTIAVNPSAGRASARRVPITAARR